MKFLCEHCKAKYQIADEKVAGRTVRMKCRKCGNLIEVRAAVTETSVNAKLPTDPRGAEPVVSTDASKTIRGGKPLATSLSAAPKPAPARAPQARSGDSGLAGAFHRNVQKEEEISVALDLRELSASDEWYVAINGVPVGPIRVGELRRKAALGVVTEDSLCWQEGMEEWRPVRAVAELAALVREAASGGRTSLLTPPPAEARPHPGPAARPASSRPAPTSPAAAAPIAPRPPRPAQSAPGQFSNVVPITSRLATAEKLHEEPAPTAAAAVNPILAPAVDPFAGPAAPSPFGSAAALVAPLHAPAPPAPAPPSPAEMLVPAPAVSGAEGSAAYRALGVPSQSSSGTVGSAVGPVLVEKRSPPYIAIAMIVLAAAFGITAAIVLVKPAPQVVVQVPTSAPAAPAAAPSPTTSAAIPPVPAATDTAATAPAAPSPSSTGGGGKVASASRPGSSSSGSKGGSNAATDPALRDLINGTNSGPSAGPSESGGSGGGAQLTEDQVKMVLAGHKIGVQRTCWERVQTSSSTVNETVHIVVGSGGQVTSATATGNDPVVGHCLEGEVRRWTFPGSGTIDIPFHFLRQ